MAMVADEYGGTSGIVTIEDMVEEILGAVFDEHDDTETETEIRQSGTSWDCSGLVRIDELESRLGYKAPEGPYETLGGLVMTNLKRIPVEGDIIVLPDPDINVVETNPLSWSARVTSMDDRRVDRVLLTPITPEQASAMTSAEDNNNLPLREGE
jgi:transporter of the hlyC/corC family